MSEIIIGIITAASIQLIGIIFAIRHFNKSHKTEQQQFQDQTIQTNNIENVKNLIFFDEQFIELERNFVNGNKTISSCSNYAREYLYILDRLSYLYEKELIDNIAIEFFNLNFSFGKSLAKWLEVMVEANIKLSVPFFYKTFHRFERLVGVSLPVQFYYYSIMSLSRDFDGEKQMLPGWTLTPQREKMPCIQLLQMPLDLLEDDQTYVFNKKEKK